MKLSDEQRKAMFAKLKKGVTLKPMLSKSSFVDKTEGELYYDEKLKKFTSITIDTPVGKFKFPLDEKKISDDKAAEMMESLSEKVYKEMEKAAVIKPKTTADKQMIHKKEEKTLLQVDEYLKIRFSKEAHEKHYPEFKKLFKSAWNRLLWIDEDAGWITEDKKTAIVRDFDEGGATYWIKSDDDASLRKIWKWLEDIEVATVRTKAWKAAPTHEAVVDIKYLPNVLKAKEEELKRSGMKQENIRKWLKLEEERYKQEV